ncbi:ribosomal protection-like ABC-F family protein [Sporosarcina limicola]|uniref:Macrolide transport system ATP-binding/permease protein n=1 Tax=Sporosarcina limicola TaxID=34101 RepID=A0A927RCY9_9BACL|nr:ABC-F family ATP-binding cassette domain-containing protein [Sporosarcina limicola]MBE1553187.1 macrolide transport system ATP-binding/permease protein [Sporosarcina limicola]
MLIGTLNHLSFAHGETVILNRLSADIPEGACIAIVGANGAGKTTLMSMLAGEIVPTGGLIAWNGSPPSVTYFRQEQEVEGDTDWEQAETHIYRSKWHVPERVEYASASGGERMKMRLSAALAEKSRLTLLDEPTNHLDSDSLDELIRLINKGGSTYVIVTHDRHFIDQTADFVFEIEYGKLTAYKGNYSDYRDKKASDRKNQQKHYEQQQRKIAQVEGQIAELTNWSSKAHAASTKKDGFKEHFRMKAKKRDVQVRSMRTRLEAELEKDRIDKPENEVDVSFEVKGQQKKGKRVLECKGVRKAFAGRELFKDVSFTVQAGERIALVGPNGTGKSTLFKMALGEESYAGELWKTAGMSIGYLSQTVLDLPGDMTMAEYFYADTFQEQGMIRINLTNLGFSEKQWNLPLSALSQGERVKVKLMQFILEGMDVLLLDEPTNHLDLPSREELEKTLETFPGTLLFASHDRYFNERMADGLLIFGDGTIQKVPMTLREWEERGVVQQTDNQLEERLRLETEMQAVLGKLSLMKPGSGEYARLDRVYNELSRRLKALK